MLTESTAHKVELAGYALIVISAFFAVFLWERAEKVAHKLHVAAGLGSFLIVNFAVAQENAQFLVTFPCLPAAQRWGFCTPHPHVPKAQPSWSETQFHTVPKEFALWVAAMLVATGIRRLVRKPATN